MGISRDFVLIFYRLSRNLDLFVSALLQKLFIYMRFLHSTDITILFVYKSIISSFSFQHFVLCSFTLKNKSIGKNQTCIFILGAVYTSYFVYYSPYLNKKVLFVRNTDFVFVLSNSSSNAFLFFGENTLQPFFPFSWLFFLKTYVFRWWGELHGEWNLLNSFSFPETNSCGRIPQKKIWKFIKCILSSQASCFSESRMSPSHQTQFCQRGMECGTRAQKSPTFMLVQLTGRTGFGVRSRAALIWGMERKSIS